MPNLSEDQKRELSAQLQDVRIDLRKEAGRWLRQQREAKGLTQRDLAERVGSFYYTFVSQIESGRGKIPPERYADWAEGLEINPRVFAIRMLSFYEPATYKLIFGDE